MTQHTISAATRAMKGKTMKRLVSTMLSATCVLAPLAFAPVQSAQAQSAMRPASDVVLSIGRGQLITVGGNMADVFVANDQIADVQVKSQRQLYVFGKAGGETTVYASNAAGDIIWSANIRVGSNIDSVDQMLRMAMPDAKVAVSTMGTGTFLLTGTVGAPEDAAEATRLVQAFVAQHAAQRIDQPLIQHQGLALLVLADQVLQHLHRQLLTSIPTVEPVAVVLHQEHQLVTAVIEAQLHRCREPAQQGRQRFFVDADKGEGLFGFSH